MLLKRIYMNRKQYLAQVYRSYTLFRNSQSLIISSQMKETFTKKFLKNWINLYSDYKEVVVEVIENCRIYPMRTTAHVSVVGLVCYCLVSNPDEVIFRDQLISNTLKLVLISEEVRNPISASYLKWLQQNLNEGLIKRLNLGIISFLWLDNYDSKCVAYKATCQYLKPEYSTWNRRVIDVGFLNNWWILNNSMKDYDINYQFLQTNTL
ncbi:mitochondrial import inner membrane translocase subunit Tim29 [Copidosoma floridanum]|uniref:mitochondrial import inner membrane translocase subunit Tim29 n=1 Tax=Copidosoma floridanum TaxID=29053 RepID=UPI0006C9B3EF|nr:mitochondrial import inner membrane translocase subunit Tim29 [Copidosoma floridanum]